MKINLRAFDEIDLNLMVIFIVIYNAESITRAALELGVGQPAVSGSLSRLRARFDDPLFERAGGRMRPTDKAHDIARQLTPAITMIESILGSQGGAASHAAPDTRARARRNVQSAES